MGVIEQVQAVVEPIIATHPDVELYDIEHASGVLRIMLDRPGGINVDVIGEMAQAISEALDENDPLPNSRYLLEVTSPGIERKLRTPEHFLANIGEDVNVKTVVNTPGERRLTAVLLSADQDGIELDIPHDGQATRRIAYADIEAARTVFHWGEQTTSPGAKAPKAASKKTDSKKAAKAPKRNAAVPESLPASDEAPGETTIPSTNTNKKASAT